MVAPIKVTDLAKRIRSSDRTGLVSVLEEIRDAKRNFLRNAIVKQRRTDLLARDVLGYDVEPLHLAILRHNARNVDSLTMAFRGSGKTTVGTVVECVAALAANRDLRILISSKTKGNAESMLKEIKGHLENNQELIELFGPFFDNRKTTKWDNTEIDVLGRKKVTKEASITCAGFDSAVVSKHYDIFFPDDLVDDTNSATLHMRDKLQRWYYQSLMPCLEPPSLAVPRRGENHRNGTHYHFADLYVHLRENELKDRTLVIPALDKNDRSALPKKFTSEFFKKARRDMGSILFGAQYLCDTTKMRGEIFQYDQCQRIYRAAFPPKAKLHIFGAADLAISELSKNDQFAIVILGFTSLDEDSEIYVLDYYADRIRFAAQTDMIIEKFKEWDPIRFAIETNAYQMAQYQQVVDSGKVPPGRLVPVQTDKDKLTRAWKMSAEFEAMRVYFPIEEPGRKSFGPMIDQFVLFPNNPLKDLVDAFDLALRAKRRGRRRRNVREEEVGLL